MGGGGKSSQTVGFRYYMGVHFGLCLAQIDLMDMITVGDRIAWFGALTYPGSGSFAINAPMLFGGEKKEGGIQGDATLLWGDAAQGANAYLSSKQGGLQPAYRGLTTLVYNGMISCMNPYPKPWAFRVTRILQGWSTAVWQPDYAAITYTSGFDTIRAMNPAHIVYQCLTDTEWGMGYPTTVIDEDSFIRAAEQCYCEGFGLCLKWNRQDSIENFIQIVCNHVGAVVSNDRRTGKFRFDLIREDYDVDTLPTLGPDNILSMSELESPTLEDAMNEVTVIYRDPMTNKDGSITLQSLAGIQSLNGRVVSGRNEYPGIPVPELAARVGVRDLKTQSSGLKRVKLDLDRSCYLLRPGMACKFVWPPDGLNLVMRIVSIEYGTLNDGKITIHAVEDVFGLSESTYLAVQPPTWVEPDTSAQPITTRKVYEAGYRDVLQALSPGDFSVLPTDIGYIASVALEPTAVSLNFGVVDRVDPDAFVADDSGDFSAGGFLAEVMDRTQTTMTLEDFQYLDLVTVGDPVWVGNEMMKVTSINTTTGVVGVGRAVCDTVPDIHLVGESVFFFQDYAGFGNRQFALGEDVDVKLLTQTASDVLAEADALEDTVTIMARKDLPYPPAGLQVNGEDYPSVLSGSSLNFTWVTRNRLTQADVLVDQSEATVAPESGQTTRIRFFDMSEVLLDTHAGLVGTSTTVSAPTGAGSFIVVVDSQRDGYDSWQAHEWVMQVTSEGELASTLGTLTLAATGGLPAITGTAASTLGDLTVASTGIVGEDWDGTLISTLDPLTLTAVGNGGVPAPTLLDITDRVQDTAATSHLLAMPATVNSGDMLVVYLHLRSADATDAGVSVSPAGWTQFAGAYSPGFGADGANQTLGFFLRAAGTEGGTNVSFETFTATQFVAMILRFQAGTTHTSSSPATQGAVSTLSGSTSPDPPSASLGSSGTNKFWIAGFGAPGTGAPSVYPTNFPDNRRTLSSGGGALPCRLVIATATFTTVPINPAAFTVTSTRWAAFTSAIFPPP